MPELPEVENLRIGLEKAIIGQKVKRVLVHKPKLVSGKNTLRTANESKRKEFMEGLVGKKFIRIERRAKNLIFYLSHSRILLGHLKMSGQFAYSAKDKSKSVLGGHPIEISEYTLPNKHSHIIFELTHGTLFYNDTRMFGYLLYFPSTEAFEEQNHFKIYGLEPLSKEFTAKYLFENLQNKSGRAKGRAGKIKSVLLDQKIVTGLGNIYADETLFEARIRPDRSASSISKAESGKLHKAIIRILNRAILVGGSSVATYRLLDESQGNYAREHKVYGKAGKKCVRCGTTLQKTLIQTRTTVFCPKCQK